MIFDRLENCDLYCVNDYIKKGFDYLKSNDLTQLDIGRYEIDSDKLFVLIQEYDTKPIEECRWESHKKYLDIQYIISGSELMGYVNIDQLTDAEDHTPVKDIIYYKDGNHKGNTVRVSAGEFALFFPQDGHIPNVANGSVGKNKKAVVKILL